MKTIINIGLMLLVCVNFAQAQIEPGSFGNYQEALLFSQTTLGGTARIQAIGSTQVSLGGDISSAYSNPAGLGFFNRSQVTLTPAINFHDSESDFLNSKTTSFKNNFRFNNIGVAFRKNANREGKFKGGTFAISGNRINDFNNEYRFEGFNGKNSIVNSFIEIAGVTNPANLSGFEKIAYDHYLIDLADYSTDLDYVISPNGIITPNKGDGSFEGYASLFGTGTNNSFPTQIGTVRTSGSQYQWSFSYGANYNDFLYFGGGIGIQSVNYDRKRTFIESNFKFSDGSADDLVNEIRIDDFLNITGIGINATLGLIARPNDFLRIGISYITPTSYTLSEESEFNFRTDWNPFYSYALPTDTVTLGTITTQSDLIVSNYNLKSPSKLNAGLAVFVGKHGFISGDIEFVNYGNAQLKSNDFSPTADNRTISNLYTNTINYRAGSELRYEMFRIRVGYSHQGDPFKNGNINRSIEKISGGIGYRINNNYFVDLAIVNTKSKTLFRQYQLANGQDPVANIKNNTTSISVTAGFNF